MATRNQRAHAELTGERHRLAIVLFGYPTLARIGTGSDLAEKSERACLGAPFTSTPGRYERALREVEGLVASPGEDVRAAQTLQG